MEKCYFPSFLALLHKFFLEEIRPIVLPHDDYAPMWLIFLLAKILAESYKYR